MKKSDQQKIAEYARNKAEQLIAIIEHNSLEGMDELQALIGKLDAQIEYLAEGPVVIHATREELLSGVTFNRVMKELAA